MRALSLTQPWATLVAIGAKKVETRSWGTSARGTIVIHASKGFPAWARDYCTDARFRNAMWPDLLGRADAYTVARERLKLLPLGQIVAVARLAHVMPTTAAPSLPMSWNATVYQRPDPSSDEYHFGDYAAGRFMWFLENVIALPKPITCRGALSLWEVPDEVAAEVRAQTGIGNEYAEGLLAGAGSGGATVPADSRSAST